MANLIPPEIQHDLRHAVFARYVFTTAAVALVCALLVLLMLVPSYVALTQNASDSSDSSAISTAQQTADKVTLAQETTLLAQLASVIQATTTSVALADALALRPSGVAVDQAMYTAGTTSTLVLIGSASDGSDVSAYRNALASSTVFTSVSVPVGALVGALGGRFSITLSGIF